MSADSQHSKTMLGTYGVKVVLDPTNSVLKASFPLFGLEVAGEHVVTGEGDTDQLVRHVRDVLFSQVAQHLRKYGTEAYERLALMEARADALIRHMASPESASGGVMRTVRLVEELREILDQRSGYLSYSPDESPKKADFQKADLPIGGE